jgi:hypothetical protein
MVVQNDWAKSPLLEARDVLKDIRHHARHLEGAVSDLHASAEASSLTEAAILGELKAIKSAILRLTTIVLIVIIAVAATIWRVAPTFRRCAATRRRAAPSIGSVASSRLRDAEGRQSKPEGARSRATTSQPPPSPPRVPAHSRALRAVWPLAP